MKFEEASDVWFEVSAVGLVAYDCSRSSQLSIRCGHSAHNLISLLEIGFYFGGDQLG